MTTLMKDTSLNSDQEEMLKITESCGHHMLSIINDVLELSKIEAGSMELESRETDLGELIRDTINMMTPIAKSKNLLLSTHQASNLPKVVLTDSVKLKRILVNLVGNAVKVRTSFII